MSNQPKKSPAPELAKHWDNIMDALCGSHGRVIDTAPKPRFRVPAVATQPVVA